VNPDVRLENPGELLTQAANRLAASESWTLTARPDYFYLEAAVRPGAQWHRMEATFGGDAFAVLIRDEYAYLYGMWQTAMVGYTRSPEAIEAVIGDRWLQCDAAAFLRGGNDHTALAQVTKLIVPHHGVRLHRVETSTAGRTAILSCAFRGVCAVQLDAPDGPLLVGLGVDPAGELMADLSYGPGPALPDPADRGVITLAEAMAGFSARRKRPRSKRTGHPARTRRGAEVDVTAPEDDDLSWAISSHDLLPAWGVETGYQAEELVRELVSQEAPQLIDALQFDSYAEAFSAYSDSETVARALAELLRRTRT
jgi:hypothetical protein